MNILNNYLKKYAYIIFILVTFVIMLIRTPFWDEAHSFQIASCSIKEIFYLTRIEGHPILWFLILKPFASIKLYPYSMYIINWLFCVLSIYILFKKSHFSYPTKALIAFSTPFLLYFAPVARCYSVGIFFIFLMCIYFPLRFKKPYIYSLLIALASQTSLMVMIGVFYMGLIYLFELINRYRRKILSKKTLISVLLIFLSVFIFTVLEFAGIKTPNSVYTNEAINDLIYFAILPYGVNIPSFILRLLSCIMLYTLPYFLFKYCKKGLFFIFFTFLTMIVLFVFIHRGTFWNYYFYYIYFIVLFWTYGKKLLKIKFLKVLFISIIFFMTIPYAVQNGTVFEYIYSSRTKLIADYILKNPEYLNSKLYVFEWWSEISPGADIYLKQKGIKIFNKNNVEKGSFQDLKETFKLRDEVIDFDEFISNAPEKFYILSDGNIPNQKFKSCFIEKRPNMDMVLLTKKGKYMLKQVDNQIDNMELIIYKVIKL